MLRPVLIAAAAAALVAAVLAARAADDELPPADYTPRIDEAIVVSADARRDALRRARVWSEPSDARARLSAGLPLDERGILRCRFLPKEPTGTTPKFDCVLPGGEWVRVKYGWTPEIHAEAAATKLFATLGFPTDDVRIVPRVRCFGCPRSPFYTLQVLERIGARDFYSRMLDYDDYVDFESAAVERRFPAPAIEAKEKGWAWHELGVVEGDSRAHVDALRLLAVFVAHWDNKAENQRLVCLSRERDGCTQPLAIVQDLGGTFGPRKVNLAGWRGAPVWADRAACRVSMRGLPYDGATFADVAISEDGRRFLAGRLAAMAHGEIRELFARARFDEPRVLRSDESDLDQWVGAFQAKVRDIATGPPCPPVRPPRGAG